MKIWKIALLLHILLTSTIPATAEEKAETPTGHYYGVGWQNDGSHWSIDVFLDERGGKITYPSLSCDGVWTKIGTKNPQFQYIEQIVRGAENCIVLGTVTLGKLPNGTLEYAWQEHAVAIDARAILAPVDGAQKSYMEMLKLTLNAIDLKFMMPEFLE